MVMVFKKKALPKAATGQFAWDFTAATGAAASDAA